MAQVYDIGCMSCGHVWQWYKYDEPDRRCPRCHTDVAVYDKTVWSGDAQGAYVWNTSKVKVFGVGSTGEDTDVFQAIFADPQPFRLLSGGKSHVRADIRTGGNLRPSIRRPRSGGM